ncbi:MAG: hypothetical protein DCC50_08065 [Acidobacteria bacterium]|nr:MAG: hypothetical protein DCC50_08065 [Acidobacteriota bacterium]
MTTAAVSVEKDRAKRMWEYLTAMGFRLVAFPVSVWMLMNDMVVIGLVLAVVAVVIPSVAVVLANNVDRRGTASRPEPVTHPVQRLDPGTTAAPRGPTGHDVEGTVVSSEDTPYRPEQGDEGTTGRREAS